MLKHSASHGCATFVCTVLAGFIVFLTRRFIPGLLDLMTPIAAPIAGFLDGIPFFTEENIEVLVLAGVLALAWGVVFKVKVDRA